MDKDTLINKFFENTLDAAERQLFNELMETDKAFADQVVFEQKTKAALTLNSREALKSKLQDYEKVYSKKPASSNQWLFVAAGIAAIIGLIVFIQPQQLSNPDLYSEYFTAYPNTVAPIVRSENKLTDNSEAFEAYESKDYETATVLFHQIYGSSQEEYARFYEAISLMATKNFEESKDILATTEWSSDYSEKARWYLALNYLAINQTKNSRIILENILRDKSYQYKKAKKLLEKME